MKLNGRKSVVFCLLLTLTEGRVSSKHAAPRANLSPVVTATAPQSSDRYTYSRPTILLNSSTQFSGSVYHNDFFGFTYRLPQGWTAENLELTYRRNVGVTVRAEPAGAPLTAQTLKVLAPVIIFNATPTDKANRNPRTLPFVSIQANPSENEHLSVENIRRTLDSGESAREAHDIKLLSGPAEITIIGHSFFRTDFSEKTGGNTIWKTFFQTSIHGGVLIFTFCADSKAELEQLLTTVRSIVFDEPSPAIDYGAPQH
ncbi:MAG: hypothetical protein WAL95_23110 [Candidatus Acidiferrales bacterium]